MQSRAPCKQRTCTAVCAYCDYSFLLWVTDKAGHGQSTNPHDSAIPAGAEAAQFGEMLEAQIFPTLLQQQIHAILWMGCTPALDATILHLRHRDISVTTVDPLPEHASFVPGGVHLIAPYAQLPAQVERHSVDLVRSTALIWPPAA